MVGNIKGITIELNGDTTKLDRALRSVNRETQTLQRQLIVTTHDTSQLSLERFRRDQIYFTEKDPKTGASDLYSLDDFEKPVRKDENIRKKYLQGRYGAIPYVHAEDLL